MNRLQYETSPYLLQHATNPVDWYPWSEEALQQAKAQDKPILLSIGYSACHWCHVMAHESFEDPDTAAMMNSLFINIKVDREERPDVDDIYMQATLLYTNGHGGWPMTVFLTPDGRPFHGGTYYPRESHHGMPSFRQLMQAVHDAFTNRRDEVERAANTVTDALQNISVIDANLPQGELDEVLLEAAARKLISRADTLHGGLHGGQPKFPSPMNLEFLLRHYTTSGKVTYLNTVTFTLKKMARGGIYDQLGGGFHRYSVDNRWLVPHFEKMLYDNAQLARVYLHAYQITHDTFFAKIVDEILTYLQREMFDDCGGFYSAQDADSEGEEGKFFVWSYTEINDILREHLPPKAIEAFMTLCDITEMGNFEGKNILNRPFEALPVAQRYEMHEAELLDYAAQARRILFEKREKRIKPHRDEKMLAAWNGMTLAAFAEAGRVLENPTYRQIAEQNAMFILSVLSAPDGTLYRTHKRKSANDGESKFNAYLEDYANIMDGLLELYQTTFDVRWFNEARRLADHVITHFTDHNGKGFFDTRDDHEKLITRPKSLQDNATPSGNNLMAYNLVRLAAYTGNAIYETIAHEHLEALSSGMQEYPSAFGNALIASHLWVHHPIEVAIVGNPDQPLTQDLLKAIQRSFYPRIVTAFSPQDSEADAIPELLAHRTQHNGQPTVYICEKFLCKQPVTTVEAVHDLLKPMS